MSMVVNGTNKRTCKYCGALLKGRADKIFCHDYCRNNFNNQLKATDRQLPMVRNISNALMKNRKILSSLLPENQETIKANRDKLSEMGFIFRYITEVYTARNGNTYHYCYDHGYRQLENGWVLIVRKKET